MVQVIAFDAGSNSAANGSASPLTWSHVCTGSNRALVVTIMQNAANDVSAVTYNSIAMTLVDVQASLFGGSKTLYTYLLLNPASGSNSISVTFTTTNLGAAAASYTGVKQASGPNAHGTFTGVLGTTYSEALASTVDNCWHVSGISGSVAGNVISAGSSTSVRAHNETIRTIAIADSNAAITPAGSNTLNFSAGSMTWASNGLILAPQPDITTLVGTSGTLTFTGNASILHRILTMVAAAGSFTFTAAAATLTRIRKWINQTKNSSSETNQTKHSSNWTNSAKHTSSETNQTKH